jgi:tetratricopeptide (TPR) repeat protein
MRYFIVILIFWIGLQARTIGQTQEHIDSLVSILDQDLNDTIRVNILNRIASDLLYINSEEIKDYGEQALDLSRYIGYQKGVAEALNNLGIYYRTKGSYKQAIEYYFESLEIMEELNYQNGIARCYNLIGIIYFFLNNYELSLEYYQKALEINIQQNDKKWIAGNSNNIGMIYERMNEYEKALDYYNKSLKANLETNNENWIANNYGNIGSLYQRMGNPKSLEYYFKRLDLKEEIGDIPGIARSKNLIGGYYNQIENYSEAIFYYHSSYKLSEKSNDPLEMSIAADGLSQAYAGNKKYDSAYKYIKISKLLNDSLKIDESSQKIKQLEMQYQFNKEQKLEEIRYQKYELFQVMIAIGLFLILLLVILLFGRQRGRAKQIKLEEKHLEIENQRLQDELKFKDQLLNDNVKYLVDKNDLINKVTEKLVEIKPAIARENQKIINDVIIDLQSGLDSDIWEEFELRFNQVHTDFYENLSNKFPELTANDKKLCAFLRLNMTSREISALTKQSIKSIETGRIRLRKKLHISNTDISLYEFLKKFS